MFFCYYLGMVYLLVILVVNPWGEKIVEIKETETLSQCQDIGKNEASALNSDTSRGEFVCLRHVARN